MAPSSFVSVLAATTWFTSCIAAGAASNSSGCTAVQQDLADKVFHPGDAVYEYEVTQFWSNTELLNSSCVFRPTSADDVSQAVVAMVAANASFAVRGGGHMGIEGANNIDGGVLMVMSNLTTLSLSPDSTSVTVGPGQKWGSVYSYLSQYNLACAGGRLSPVGVPGLLLGGGVTFHGNQYGWAADNVLSYEVVLANGSIVTASDTNHTDLFWALKGGSSNFGIVTNFELRTIPSPGIWGGTYTVSEEHLDDFLAAVANFSASNNTDPLSHAVPMVIPQPTLNTTVAAVILFYDSPTISNPDCFAPFLTIPSISNTCAFTTVSALATANGALVTDHINDIFFAGTVVGMDYDSLLLGVQIINDIFLSSLPALYAIIPPSALSLISIDWQPITPLWTSASARSNPLGNALGIDSSLRGTYLCWAGVVEWFGSDYDEVVENWVQETTAKIEAATREALVYDAFLYMGDAAAFQISGFYTGYGGASLAGLNEVSRRYDPERALQRLWPGGFKLGEFGLGL